MNSVVGAVSATSFPSPHAARSAAAWETTRRTFTRTAQAAADGAGQLFHPGRWAALRSWIARLVKLPILVANAIVCLVLGSEGIRQMVPTLSRPLASLPLCTALEGFEETATVDIAAVVSVILGVAVCLIWTKVIRLYLHPSDPLPGSSVDAPQRHPQLVRLIALLLGGADLVLFFLGLANLSDTWSNDGGAVFSAIVMTSVYAGLVLFGAYLTVLLERKLS
jgi:hypothetical protein